MMHDPPCLMLPAESGELVFEANPPFINGEPALLRWRTSGGRVGLVYVSRDGDNERLLACARDGAIEIDWIDAESTYQFILRSAASDQPILKLLELPQTAPPETAELRMEPDPLPFTSSRVLIHWRTNRRRPATLYVSRNGDEKQLLASATEGVLEIDWIAYGSTYEFSVHGGDDGQTLLHRLIVRRSAIPWDEVRREISWVKLSETERDAAAVLVGELVSRQLLHAKGYKSYFNLWEQNGLHITPVHFYQPIPDTGKLPDTIWTQHAGPAIDMRVKSQLNLIRTAFAKFRSEYDRIPQTADDSFTGYFIENGRFEGLDGLTAYCMVRHFRPRRIFEIGGGYSSLILAQAAVKNGATSLKTIEPYPMPHLQQGFPGLAELYQQDVQSLPPEFFDELEANDILFIDSSHVVKTGGDVNYLFLEILPRLAPGTLVHVHDINFPFDYPRNWVIGDLRFWTEQYLLQAFLSCNSEFETLLCNSYLATYHQSHLREAFPTLEPFKGGSFWMRRREPFGHKLYRRLKSIFRLK